MKLLNKIMEQMSIATKKTHVSKVHGHLGFVQPEETRRTMSREETRNSWKWELQRPSKMDT